MIDLKNLSLSTGDLDYLKTACPYLSLEYLDFLSSFRFQPSKHIKITLLEGEVQLVVDGLWTDTILYEIPLLALISEAYFKFCDRDWSYNGQEAQAYQKGIELLEHGCTFSEFGTRRRRDYHTQDTVLKGLKRAATVSKKGSFSGTSNLHFAMKYNILPVGTVAHEWFMGIAAAKHDYKGASETALRCWLECFGTGVLAITLTDTFGTPAFLRAFKKQIPQIALRDNNENSSCTYAQVFAGVRQDSGDPKKFIQLMHDFYREQDIRDKKTMVFSDSLDIDRCLEYKKAAEEFGFNPTFGIGTFLTSKFVRSLDACGYLPTQMTSPTPLERNLYLSTLSSSYLQRMATRLSRSATTSVRIREMLR